MGKRAERLERARVAIFKDLVGTRNVYTREDAVAYNRFAPFYYDYPGDARTYVAHVKRLLGELPGRREPGRGLELGAGMFLFGKELAGKGIPMDGVDNSEGMVIEYARQQKEGHGQDLVLSKQDCTVLDMHGRAYDHAVSHGYLMWVFDKDVGGWVLTSYTRGHEDNLDVFRRTASHLREGSPFLINAFPHRGDYSKPKRAVLPDGGVYSCEYMDIVGGKVRKHHRITGSSGVEWEAVFVRSRFSPRTAESVLERAGFEIEGFDDPRNPKWYITRKRLPRVQVSVGGK